MLCALVARCAEASLTDLRERRTGPQISAMPSAEDSAQPPHARAGLVLPADVIIVLGGGVRRDGTLTVVSRARVEHALDLYRAGVAPRLIMTGRHGAFLKKPISEAHAMATLARAAGVPDHAILIEDNARDTLGNACFTRDHHLAPNQWRRVHVVTSDFHRKRAYALFCIALGADYKCVFSAIPSGFTRTELVLRLLEPIKPIKLALFVRLARLEPEAIRQLRRRPG